MAEGKKKQNKEELHDFVVEFRKYKTTLNRKYRNRKPYSPPDESKIISFIPGTINTVFVKEGQYVEQGQELMILEAMKMQNRVFASRSGTIVKVHVTEGEKVPKSKVIFELELD